MITQQQLDKLNIKLNLLSLDNPKLQKQSLEMGYLAASLPLAPHNYASNKSLCPNATKADCYMHCLFFTGHSGMMPKIRESRSRKTRMFIEQRKLFMNLLIADISILDAIAEEYNLKLAIRLNAFSDINWCGVYHYGDNIFNIFPNVIFYDYTKVPRPLDKIPPNYKLTFSYSPNPNYEGMVKKAEKYGMNMTVVFRLNKGESLPKYWNGKAVIDGDKHDLRFLDPENCIVGLKEKKITNKEHAADKRIGLAVELQ